jgi:hypothetical protein
MITRRFVPVLATLIVVTSLTAWSQAAEITPVKVIGGGLDQFLPSANANWIGWSSNSTAAPSHYDAFVRPLVAGVPTGTIYKLNAGTTFGWSADMQTDANTTAFQRTNAAGTRSDIYTADLGTLPPVAVAPVSLNTPDWEWGPVITQSWILFGRISSTRGGIFLYDRSSHVTISLTNQKLSSSRRTLVTPGDVTQTYATWTRCEAICNVYYYNLSSHVTTLVANPTKAMFYDPAISDDTGDMYFIRSGNGCGVNAKIFRWHIGGAATYTVVSSLPTGYDSVDKSSVFYDGTHDTLYFDRLKCAGSFYSDILKVPSADTAS